MPLQLPQSEMQAAGPVIGEEHSTDTVPVCEDEHLWAGSYKGPFVYKGPQTALLFMDSIII